jgi:hypothetical protein
MAYLLSEELYTYVKRIVKEWLNDPKNINTLRGRSEYPRVFRWGKITAADTTEDDNIFLYTWTEQRRTTAGWDDMTEGLTGKEALNSIEEMNSVTGEQGNGVDISLADYPTGFSVKPAPVGVIVLITEDYNDDGAPVYSFSYENSVDGPCVAGD